MAEVCVNQISLFDLVQSDSTNENREAFTYAGGLKFGTVMIGKRTMAPADLILLKRLNMLIHGDVTMMMGHSPKELFDINLTSPSVSIALGLMYIRTD